MPTEDSIWRYVSSIIIDIKELISLYETGISAAKLAKDDLYKTSRGYCDGSTDHYITFRCSACGVETDVKDVPHNITDKIISKESWIKRHEYCGETLDDK